MRRITILALFVFFFSTKLIFCQIVINEIQVEPVGDEPEWIEFYNNSDDPSEIFFAYITDGATSKKISLFKIYGYAYTLVTKDTTALKQRYSIPDNCILIEATIPTLNNTNDIITLRNTDSTLIDSVYYDMNWGKKGISLERRISTEPAISSDNWTPCSLPDSATPGYKNSNQFTNDTVKALTIEPNPFSPFASDGTNICNISYKLPYKHAEILLVIFDMEGNVVKELANNEFSSEFGHYYWDGKNSDGTNLQIGPYILYLEASDSDSENVHQERSIIVIGK